MCAYMNAVGPCLISVVGQCLEYWSETPARWGHRHMFATELAAAHEAQVRCRESRWAINIKT